MQLFLNAAYREEKQQTPILGPYPGADPGFQVRGGWAHLKKLGRAEGGAKDFGVFRVKNHDFTPKKSDFFQMQREARKFLGYFV